MTNIIPSATKTNLFAKKCYTFIEKSANKFLIDTERYGFMIYKPSKFNYFFVDSDELMIVNFKKGLSTFTIVTGDDIALVKENLSSENICINHPTDNLPDAVILCVNSYDETDYVGRTIKYIESCVDSKVIALVVYPMGYNDQLGRSRLVHLSDTELNKSVYMLSSKFNIPTYILGKESDMEKLYTTVIAFLRQMMR